MLRSTHVYAFQLVIGDNIMLGGRYLQISNIRGSYEHGRGVVVDICTQMGWTRLFVNASVEVYRHE